MFVFDYLSDTPKVSEHTIYTCSAKTGWAVTNFVTTRDVGGLWMLPILAVDEVSVKHRINNAYIRASERLGRSLCGPELNLNHPSV